MTLEQLIERLKDIYGNKYDYSKITNVEDTVTLICPEHGEFVKKTNYVLYSKFRDRVPECPKCYKKQSGRKPYTTQSYIEKAKCIHGDIYDYSKTVYAGKFHNVMVNCKKHGPFRVLPADHLKGDGCQMCIREQHAKIKNMNEQ